MKMVYIIAHKGYYGYSDEKTLYFLVGMRDGAYDTTYDITKAKRFESRDEVFDFLRHYCYYRGTILLEFTEEYLERIKDDEAVKRRLRDPLKY